MKPETAAALHLEEDEEGNFMSSDEKVMSKAEKFEKLNEAKSKQIARLEKENDELTKEIKKLNKEVERWKLAHDRLHTHKLFLTGKVHGFETAIRIIHGKEAEIRYYDSPRDLQRTSEEDID